MSSSISNSFDECKEIYDRIGKAQFWNLIAQKILPYAESSATSYYDSAELTLNSIKFSKYFWVQLFCNQGTDILLYDNRYADSSLLTSDGKSLLTGQLGITNDVVISIGSTLRGPSELGDVSPPGKTPEEEEEEREDKRDRLDSLIGDTKDDFLSNQNFNNPASLQKILDWSENTWKDFKGTVLDFSNTNNSSVIGVLGDAFLSDDNFGKFEYGEPLWLNDRAFESDSVSLEDLNKANATLNEMISNGSSGELPISESMGDLYFPIMPSDRTDLGVPPNRDFLTGTELMDFASTNLDNDQRTDFYNRYSEWLDVQSSLRSKGAKETELSNNDIKNTGSNNSNSSAGEVTSFDWSPLLEVLTDQNKIIDEKPVADTTLQEKRALYYLSREYGVDSEGNPNGNDGYRNLEGEIAGFKKDLRYDETIVSQYQDSEGNSYDIKKGSEQNYHISLVPKKDIENYLSIKNDNDVNVDIADNETFENDVLNHRAENENKGIVTSPLPEELTDYEIVGNVAESYFSEEEKEEIDIDLENTEGGV